MPSIEFSQLSKTFPNGFHALKEVNFSVEDGEFLALIGPSGCGKTTLLRILAGLETPTSGTIRVDNKEIIHLEPSERNIGMVFQNYALFPHLSTFQNMSFGLKAQKVSTEETQAKVHQVAQRLEIKDFWNENLTSCLEVKGKGSPLVDYWLKTPAFIYWMNLLVIWMPIYETL